MFLVAGVGVLGKQVSLGDLVKTNFFSSLLCSSLVHRPHT